MQAYTVKISPTKYFGARLHATMQDAVAVALNSIRDSGCVIRDRKTGKRYSISEAQKLITSAKGGVA